MFPEIFNAKAIVLETFYGLKNWSYRHIRTNAPFASTEGI
jgi:hypothetical protein